jgi:hypothetical protein
MARAVLDAVPVQWNRNIVQKSVEQHISVEANRFSPRRHLR